MNNLNSEIWNSLSEDLKTVNSFQPFFVLHYGSRERGDFTDSSDRNFFLLASGQDHIRTSFTHDINSILNDHFTEEVSLISGDKDSLLYRLEIFEPTAVHLMELGRPVYGEVYFQKFRSKWDGFKSKNIEYRTLQNYLEKRIKFYKSLESKSTQEDISRIEKIISLTIINWILYTIDEISITELTYFDIPVRLSRLVREYYGELLPKDIHLLASIYEELHELKRSMRVLISPGSDHLSKIKESILQIQDLSTGIENIV